MEELLFKREGMSEHTLYSSIARVLFNAIPETSV